METNIKTKETVTIPKTEYESLKQQVAWLMDQLKLSKRRQFGVSSEKSDHEQMSIFNEAETAEEASVTEPELEEVKSYRRKQSRTAQDRIPPDLPVEEIEHTLPKDERICPECRTG